MYLFDEYLSKKLEDSKKTEKQNKIKNMMDELMSLKYQEIINYNNFIEEKTPYSTQHWTKGDEYNNVLIIIDDSHRWYKYRWFNKLVSWEKLNKDEQKSLDARERLLNLLYVSVSRAKEKLAILYLSDLDWESLAWWESVFWKENINQF